MKAVFIIFAGPTNRKMDSTLFMPSLYKILVVLQSTLKRNKVA